MKRFTLSLLMTLCCAMLLAQQRLSFSVLEFEQDVFDTSAKSSEYGKKDGNGSWYAIIKVTSNNPDDDITACQFNFGNMSSKVERHDEALWVYVQRNAKKVTISRPGYHTISQYDLQTTIEAGVVYKMILTSDRVQQQVVYDVKMQKVKFMVTPAISGVMITATNQSTGKELVLGTTDANGIVYKVLDTGKYTYRALSSDNLYYPSEGMMTLITSDQTHEEKILLKPNFAEVKLSVPNNAEILLNNESKGSGSWQGRLTAGTYIVTARQQNHRDSQQKITVTEGQPQDITLNAPTPITGVVVVNSTPYEANVLIDGKDYGQSPLVLKDIIIGQHNLVMRKTGYGDYSTTFNLTEGQKVEVDGTLEAQIDKTFTIGGVSFTMVYVQDSTFTMGATSEMMQPLDSEIPTHQVTLSKYYIGETEVTQALWQTVMDYNPSVFKGDQNPVENVSWNDCQKFINKLNQATGKKFRLPTEAEWEFAARGGNKSRHTQYSGSNNIDEVAWLRGNSDSKTHPVKQKKANELGIYDMTGNVWEWCSDWYDSYSSSAQTNPTGPSSGSYRVLRGGSWSDFARYCRSSGRSSCTPDDHHDFMGFRLALSE